MFNAMSQIPNTLSVEITDIRLPKMFVFLLRNSPEICYHLMENESNNHLKGDLKFLRPETI